MSPSGPTNRHANSEEERLPDLIVLDFALTSNRGWREPPQRVSPRERSTPRATEYNDADYLDRDEQINLQPIVQLSENSGRGMAECLGVMRRQFLPLDQRLPLEAFRQFTDSGDRP